MCPVAVCLPCVCVWGRGRRGGGGFVRICQDLGTFLKMISCTVSVLSSRSLEFLVELVRLFAHLWRKRASDPYEEVLPTVRREHHTNVSICRRGRDGNTAMWHGSVSAERLSKWVCLFSVHSASSGAFQLSCISSPQFTENLLLPYCSRGETNRSNIRIKVFVHRCSNFVS